MKSDTFISVKSQCLLSARSVITPTLLLRCVYMLILQSVQEHTLYIMKERKHGSEHTFQFAFLTPRVYSRADHICSQLPPPHLQGEH